MIPIGALPWEREYVVVDCAERVRLEVCLLGLRYLYMFVWTSNE